MTHQNTERHAWPRLAWAVAGLMAGFGAYSWGQGTETITPEEQTKLSDKAAAGLVRVEYWLQFDKADAPTMGGWARRCPQCGQFHPIEAEGGQLVDEERPLEVPGYLVGEQLVLAPDVMIHPRFVAKIEVRYAGKTAEARPKAYMKDRAAVVLELQGRLEGTRPFVFEAGRKGPYVLVSHGQTDGVWARTTGPLEIKSVSAREDGKPYRVAVGTGVVLTRDGAAAGMVFGERLATDDSWLGAPTDWPHYPVQEYEALRERTTALADAALIRVKLNFRSPKAGSRQSRYDVFSDGEEASSATEMDTVGVVTGPSQVLIPLNLKANVTARLERITVYDKSGRAIEATFAGTLEDYGALVVRPAEPLAAITIATGPVTDYRDRLLMAAEVIVQGNNRTCYVSHRRIAGFDVGWRRQLHPKVAGEAKQLFVLGDTGQLIAVPMERRQKIQDESRYYYDEPGLVAAAYLAPVLADPAAHLDASNVPVGEAQENRLAWMGVELQDLDRELARLHKVSDLTNDGQSGSLVSYVYADSPASRAGIEAGAILLRLRVPGRSKPIEVRAQDEYGDMYDEFPWDQLDDLPEEMYDEIPKPWPSAESRFTRALTDIGFGKKYTAVFFQAGRQFEKEFAVEESPAHYDSAARFEAKELGLTVRDLTYEVRRYFQKDANDPGVIVSKIEAGRKAAVAGIRPYEIITHINDAPVATVRDFERLISGGDELRMSVKRMTQGRVVRIKRSAAGAAVEAPVRTDTGG